VSFAAITLCVASERVFTVVSVNFVLNSENFGNTLVSWLENLTGRKLLEDIGIDGNMLEWILGK
jgi:hypothetical protein